MPKIQILKILQETLHATHLLKLLDKMYKYDMDPTKTVGTTERTRDAGQTDGRTDRWTDRRTDGQSESSIPPQQLRCTGVYKNGTIKVQPHFPGPTEDKQFTDKTKP